jgi:hypothetical protein
VEPRRGRRWGPHAAAAIGQSPRGARLQHSNLIRSLSISTVSRPRGGGGAIGGGTRKPLGLAEATTGWWWSAVGSRRRIRHEPETNKNASVRGAGRCASVLCLRLSLSPPPHHFFSDPLRSPLSARAPQLLLYPSLGCSRGNGSATQHTHQARARENSWVGENPPPQSTIGCSSVADPLGRHHRARPACHGSVTREETSRCRQRSLFFLSPVVRVLPSPSPALYMPWFVL